MGCRRISHPRAGAGLLGGEPGASLQHDDRNDHCMSQPPDRRAATAVAERPAAREEQTVPPTAELRAVTWRSVLVSLLLIPPNAYWIVQMEIIRYSAHPTTISL